MLPEELRSPNSRTRWRQGFEIAVGILASLPIALFLIASLGRLRYPFPLEQLEGPMLLAAERVAHGLPIYIRPNFTFIPFMYAPAYYYVSGWAVRWMGASFVPLRLVSLLSTCASFAVIYGFVLLDARGTRGRRHLAALAGAGLYAAAYPWTREWFDLGRVDSLYILLLLIALYCTRRFHPIIAAIAWTATFLAKQTIFPVALVMLCYDWKRPKRVLTGTISFVVLAAASTAWLDRVTHGWFRFYAFTVPHANADLMARSAVTFVPKELIAPFGIALLICAIAWGRIEGGMTASFRRNAAVRFYALAMASIFGLCWFLQAHAGATSNTPMPAYAALAVVFGIAFARLDASLVLSERVGWERTALLAAVCIPLISWVYSPRDVVPKPDVRASQEEMVAWLHEFPGDVYLPSNPSLAVAAGKNWHPGVAALHDALRPDLPAVRQPLLVEIRADVDREKFDGIALDETPGQTMVNYAWLPRDLMSHYPVVGLVPGSEVVNPFIPHPVYFLLPCRELELAVRKGWTLVEAGGQEPCPQ